MNVNRLKHSSNSMFVDPFNYYKQNNFIFRFTYYEIASPAISQIIYLSMVLLQQMQLCQMRDGDINSKIENKFQQIIGRSMKILHKVSRVRFSVAKFPLLQTGKRQNILDFTRMGNSTIDAVVIVNNILNYEWLNLGLKDCSNLVVADGGANRLYDSPFRDSNKLRTIVGDFDSIQPHVKQFYSDKGIQIQFFQNQNINDFQKSFLKCIDNKWNQIICFGAFGGRMDHSLSSMSSTSKLCKKYQDLQVILVGRENIMYYMRENKKHRIKISQKINKKGCGIIRFGSKVNVKTSGFKWNLGPEHQFSTLEWGSFISSSNQIVDNCVEIESDGQLYFAANFRTD